MYSKIKNMSGETIGLLLGVICVALAIAVNWNNFPEALIPISILAAAIFFLYKNTFRKDT